MRAILMAAGVGSRIKDITSEPKCLLKIKNKPIIKNTVEMLLKNNIEVIIVTGFKEDYIKDELKGFDVKFITNSDYLKTNSIFSLYCAKEYLADECIIANADVYWNNDILNILLNYSSFDNATMLVDSSEERRLNGDYFFKTKDNRIVDYGKELTLENRSSEYVGIAKIKNQFMDIFKSKLEELISQKQYGLWWENVLYELISSYDVDIKDINGMTWGEVDTKKDYKRLLDIT